MESTPSVNTVQNVLLHPFRRRIRRSWSSSLGVTFGCLACCITRTSECVSTKTVSYTFPIRECLRESEQINFMQWGSNINDPLPPWPRECSDSELRAARNRVNYIHNVKFLLSVQHSIKRGSFQGLVSVWCKVSSVIQKRSSQTMYTARLQCNIQRWATENFHLWNHGSSPDNHPWCVTAG